MENTQPGKALKATLSVAAIAAHLFIPQKAQAWGYIGHQTVAETAASLSKPFWKANLENLGKLANIPDTVWKGLPDKEVEKPTHYFEPDGYYPTPADFLKFPRPFEAAEKEFSLKTLVDHGTATWRVEQFFNLAVVAAQKNDMVRALQMAGAMSHYVGDLSQPLHVTTNYDGQATNNKGIHKYFETDNLEKAELDQLKGDVLAQAQALLSDPKFTNLYKNKSVLDWSFVSVNRAYSWIDEVIDTDKKLGRNGKGAEKQLELAKARMAEGAAVLALIYNRIWKEAGSFQDDQSLSVKVPAWVKPIYLSKTQQNSNMDHRPKREKDLGNLPTYEDVKKMTRRDIQRTFWSSGAHSHDDHDSGDGAHDELGDDCFQ